MSKKKTTSDKRSERAFEITKNVNESTQETLQSVSSGMDTEKKGKGYGDTEEECIARINSYNNPDPRCEYPFTCEPLGYCWSFAHHIDGTKGFEDMTEICPGCDCWKIDTDPRDGTPEGDKILGEASKKIQEECELISEEEFYKETDMENRNE